VKAEFDVEEFLELFPDKVVFEIWKAALRRVGAMDESHAVLVDIPTQRRLKRLISCVEKSSYQYKGN